MCEENFLVMADIITVPTPPRAQGLLTEVWQRGKHQKNYSKIYEIFE